MEENIKQDNDHGFGICSECNTGFYPSEEVVSHGCLGDENFIIIRCACDDERERSEGPLLKYYNEVAVTCDEGDMPF